MADYGRAISLSQAHVPDDDSSEHSPRSTPASPGGCDDFSSKSKAPSNMITTLDHHRQQTPLSSENIAKKPRGRPPGSKNKPKPPIVITRDVASTMKPVILEISACSDIIDAVVSFARRNHVGINIVNVTGSVSNVTLRHPVSQAAPALTFHGPFTLLSLSGSFIASAIISSSNETPQSPPSSSSQTPCSLSPILSCCFGVTLANAQGQVFGGVVGGKVMAATQVIVVVTTFVSSAFHRLPCEGDDADHHKKTKSCIHGNVGGSAAGATESCSCAGMPLAVNGVACTAQLNSQISPDVMPWGPF